MCFSTEKREGDLLRDISAIVYINDVRELFFLLPARSLPICPSIYSSIEYMPTTRSIVNQGDREGPSLINTARSCMHGEGSMGTKPKPKYIR